MMVAAFWQARRTVESAVGVSSPEISQSSGVKRAQARFPREILVASSCEFVELTSLGSRLDQVGQDARRQVEVQAVIEDYKRQDGEGQTQGAIDEPAATAESTRGRHEQQCGCRYPAKPFHQRHLD